MLTSELVVRRRALPFDWGSSDTGQWIRFWNGNVSV
jgi:hypothetical protein